MLHRRTLLSAMAVTAAGGMTAAFAPAVHAHWDHVIRPFPHGRRSPFRTPIEVAPLKYAPDALAPVISADTVGFHHGKHHAGYLDKLKGLLSADEMGSLSLEEVILRHAPERRNGVANAIFNNAAQVWNHNFYWHSLRPGGGGRPGAVIREAIDESFGSLEALRDKMTAAAVAQFGSGWAWLVKDRRTGRIHVVTTSNAATPLTHPGQVPLLVIDVWEHAYYLDYQHRRADYARAVFDELIDWGFAEANLSL